MDYALQKVCDPLARDYPTHTRTHTTSIRRWIKRIFPIRFTLCTRPPIPSSKATMSTRCITLLQNWLLLPPHWRAAFLCIPSASTFDSNLCCPPWRCINVLPLNRQIDDSLGLPSKTVCFKPQLGRKREPSLTLQITTQLSFQTAFYPSAEGRKESER